MSAYFTEKEIPDSLVVKLEEFLTKDGIQLFEGYQTKYGCLDPIIPSESTGLPAHSVHFNEGMQVRNFLKTCDECKSWTIHDLDNNWMRVVAKVIG